MPYAEDFLQTIVGVNWGATGPIPPPPPPLLETCSYKFFGFASTTQTWTFTVGFGTPDPRRLSAVAINIVGFVPPMSITSVKINGIDATEIVTATAPTTGGTLSAIWAIPNPNGINGEVTVTTDRPMFDLNVGTYSLAPPSTTPVDTKHDTAITAGPLTITTNIPENGYLIASATARVNSDFTTTGMGEDCVIHEGAAKRTSGHYQATTAEPAHDVTIDPNLIDVLTICAAVWNTTT